jgi:hypothetical protein
VSLLSPRRRLIISSGPRVPLPSRDYGRGGGARPRALHAPAPAPPGDDVSTT